MPFMHHHTCTRLNEYGIFGLVKMVRCVWWAAVWRRGRRCWWATKDNHLSMILITIKCRAIEVERLQFGYGERARDMIRRKCTVS